MRAATIYNYLIEATLMGSALIALVLLMRRFLRGRLGNRLIYFAWLLVALRLLLPVALPNPAMNELRPTLSQNMGVRPMADQVRVRFIDAATDAAHVVGGGSVWGNGVSQTVFNFACETEYGHTARWVLLAYGVVALAVLGYMAWQNVRFRKMLRRNRVERLCGEPLKVYVELCHERGVKPIPVWMVDPLPNACLVGVFRPFIAVPLTISAGDLPQVLVHELCHHKARDEWWGVLRDLCCVVHWFNPLVWVGAFASRADAEMACDDRVTRPLDDSARLAYANTLVLSAARKNAPNVTVLATGMTMKGKHLKQRVNAILHSRKVRRWAIIVFGVLACAAMLAAFATAEKYNPPVIPEPPVAAEGYAQYVTLADEDAAREFAKRLIFNEYTGVIVDSDLRFEVLPLYDGDTWEVRAYDRTRSSPYSLDFDWFGRVLAYDSGDSDYAQAQESAEPVAGDEARKAIAFACAYADTLPGVATSYTDVHIETDMTYGDARYLVLFTSSPRATRLHRIVVQIAPEMRVLDFCLAASEYLCYITNGVPGQFTTFNESAAAESLRNDLLETTDYTAAQLESASFTAVYDEEQHVWEARMTVPAEALSGNARYSARASQGDLPEYVETRLYDENGARILDYSSLYALRTSADPILTEQQARDIAYDAVANAYGVPRAQIVEGYCDFIRSSGEYEAYCEVNDAAAEKIGFGVVSLNGHTGAIRLINTYPVNSSERTVVNPTATPESAAITPDPNPTPLPMDPTSTTQGESAFTRDEAVAMARKALVDLLELDKAFVDGLTLVSADCQYVDDPVTADRNVHGWNWVVCFSLNDPRTPFDYSVLLDAQTGGVSDIRDPSNISNG